MNHIFETGISREGLSGEDINDTKVDVYPNPSNGIFTVNSYNHTIMTINIYDMNGQKVISENILGRNIHSMDLSDQTKGIYFVKIQLSNGEIIVNKLIIK